MKIIDKCQKSYCVFQKIDALKFQEKKIQKRKNKKQYLYTNVFINWMFQFELAFTCFTMEKAGQFYLKHSV